METVEHLPEGFMSGRSYCACVVVMVVAAAAVVIACGEYVGCVCVGVREHMHVKMCMRVRVYFNLTLREEQKQYPHDT